MADQSITKYCGKCKLEKNVGCFYKNRSSKDGLHYWCKECSYCYYSDYCKRKPRNQKRYQAQWREQNKEKASLKFKKWRLANPEKQRSRVKEWDKNNPDARRAYNAKTRARRTAAPGRYSKKDIVFLYKMQRGKCIACGVSLKSGYHVDHRISLAKGGSNDPKNLDLLCPLCNREKHTKDPIEFMRTKGFLC